MSPCPHDLYNCPKCHQTPAFTESAEPATPSRIGWGFLEGELSEIPEELGNSENAENPEELDDPWVGEDTKPMYRK